VLLTPPEDHGRPILSRCSSEYRNRLLGNSSAGYFETTPVMVDIIATRIPLRPEVSMPLPSVMTAASGPGVTTRLGNWATPASIGGPLPRAWKKVPRVHPWSLVW